jgi:hypothetical protein
MNSDRLTTLALADTMLASNGSFDALVAACDRVFAQRVAWPPALCQALYQRTGAHFHAFSRDELANMLLILLGRGGDPLAHADEDDGQAEDTPAPPVLPPVRGYCTTPPIRPAAPPWLAALALPRIESSGALAAWCNEPVDDLAWLADRWRLARDVQSPLQHYHYRWLPKQRGGLRLIEIPKARLRRLQQRILRLILDRVPPHPAAHGFRQDHSCLTHAALHTGQRALLRMDLKDFFPSIRMGRIHALFEKLGYPQPVASTLARICVNRTPRAAFQASNAATVLTWAERQALTHPHLPQGSPCSPALANLCAWRLDVRLASLAQSVGARYSRYADDLVFSGGEDFERAAPRVHIQVAAIALEEGFKVNTRKTRLMRGSTRQQVTGVVVNRHPNVARDDYDRLKAILTNCVRQGPHSQNREGRADFRAYLMGRISYVVMINPARGLKLRRLADNIVWPVSMGGDVPDVAPPPPPSFN